MQKHKDGFSVTELFLIVVVIGLIGVVGLLVYERQNRSHKNSISAPIESNDVVGNDTSTDSPEVAKYEVFEGIKYTVPVNWNNAKSPFEDSDVLGQGQYFLSPEYKEGGQGQLSIEAGAYINFRKLEWVGIDSSTSPSEAVSIIKNGEGGYLDTESVKVASIADRQVVQFNSGHTTDGVSIFYKTTGGEWLDVSFVAYSEPGPEYTAERSPLYNTFQEWLEEFISLNP